VTDRRRRESVLTSPGRAVKVWTYARTTFAHADALVPEAAEDQQLIDALRLALVPGLGPRLQRSLLGRFGTAAAVFEATLEELQRVPHLGPKVARALREHRDAAAAGLELERCRRLQVRLVVQGEPGYPAMLSEICDPPPVLYCRGTLEPQDGLAVAIVGSRNCTLYGRQHAESLAAGLARAGVTIVSGLARGIDAAAHRGALTAGGRTIAVLGTGLGEIYPPEHGELAGEVAAGGAVLSEFPLDQKPLRGLFPQRNRIISGLSMGVLIVEARRNSGALHTARHAMEQGREVFAVPGRIDSRLSEGCHDLIRDGAILVRGIDDVLQALGPPVKPVQRTETEQVHTPRELALNELEREILNRITAEPQHVDEVVRSVPIEVPRVLSTLTILEMKRLVRRLPGNYLVRSPH
jgi:DNA processing protein